VTYHFDFHQKERVNAWPKAASDLFGGNLVKGCLAENRRGKRGESLRK